MKKKPIFLLYTLSILTYTYLCFFATVNLDNQPISVLRETDPLYCIELPDVKEPCEEDGAFLVLCWINVLVDEHSQARIGSCYTMQVARETSFEDLQKLLLKEMASVVHHQVICQKQEVWKTTAKTITALTIIKLLTNNIICLFFLHCRNLYSIFESLTVFAASSTLKKGKMAHST